MYLQNYELFLFMQIFLLVLDNNRSSASNYVTMNVFLFNDMNFKAFDDTII